MTHFSKYFRHHAKEIIKPLLHVTSHTAGMQKNIMDLVMQLWQAGDGFTISAASRHGEKGRDTERRKIQRILEKISRSSKFELLIRKCLDKIIIFYLKSSKLQKLLDKHRLLVHVDTTMFDKECWGHKPKFENMKFGWSGAKGETRIGYQALAVSISIGGEVLISNILPISSDIVQSGKSVRYKELNDREIIWREIQRINLLLAAYNPVFVVDSAVDVFSFQKEKINKSGIEIVYRMNRRGINIANDETLCIEKFATDFLSKHEDMLNEMLANPENCVNSEITHKGIAVSVEKSSFWIKKEEYKDIKTLPKILEHDKVTKCIRETTVVLGFNAESKGSSKKKGKLGRQFAVSVNALQMATFKEKARCRENAEKKKKERALATRNKEVIETGNNNNNFKKSGLSRNFYIIATNSTRIDPKKSIRFYKKRFSIEGKIKEMKNKDGFDLGRFRTFKFRHTQIMMLCMLTVAVSISMLKFEKGAKWVAKIIAGKNKIFFKDLLKLFSRHKELLSTIFREIRREWIPSRYD